MDLVEGPKLHAPKLRQGVWVIYGEDRLWLHCNNHDVPGSSTGPVAVVSTRSLRPCVSGILMIDRQGLSMIEQQIRAAARACPHGSNLVQCPLFPYQPNNNYFPVGRILS